MPVRPPAVPGSPPPRGRSGSGARPSLAALPGLTGTVAGAGAALLLSLVPQLVNWPDRLPVSVLAAPPARALELRGSTYFVRAPWKADMVSYYTTVWQSGVEYYVTLDLPQDAGADLGRLTIQQTRGADTSFPFSVERTRAWLGRPRQQGAAIPVQASFEEEARRFTIDFPQPVPPGSTITVALRPWRNPNTADTYLFQVTAYPAGPSPVASPVGFTTLRIYDAFIR